MSNKWAEFANRLGKKPNGLGIGVKLLGVAGAVGFGISQSIYTGK